MNRTGKVKESIIVIRVEAGHQVGMGHLYRMIALASLLKKKEFDVFFIIRTNHTVQTILEREGLEFLEFSGSIDETRVIEETLREVRLPVLWIFDTFGTGKEWFAPLHRHRVPALSFDDGGAGLEEEDIVINSIVGLWENTPITRENSRHFFKDPDYIILSENIHRYRKKREIKTSKKIKLGVSLGGSDTYNNTVKVANGLKEADAVPDRVSFFLGPHFAAEEELKVCLKEFPIPYEVERGIPDLLAAFDTMNVVICSGGVTLFEVCALGLPALTVANESHEAQTISYFRKKGACIPIGSTSSSPGELKESIISALRDAERLNATAANGLKLVDGKGIYRILEIIEKKVGMGKHA
jgi:spore coat polysaccharide biosynthesis predicted glycosyltransferase SpsG